jgi:nitrate/nitrite transporter NarK
VSALPYVVGAAGMLFWGARGAGRINVFLPFAFGALGFLSAAVFHDPVWVMASLCLASFGALGYAPVFWTLPTAFLSGTAAAIVIAAVNSVGNFAGFVGPYATGFMREATGTFVAGLYGSAVVLAIAAILVLWSARGADRIAGKSIPEPAE